MLVALLGDIHGRVNLALAALLAWQRRSRTFFDLLIQVGDLGAFPDEPSMDAATTAYAALDSTERDFITVIEASGPKAVCLTKTRARLRSPIYFIRGNHDDIKWLSGLPKDPVSGTSAVDPFDLFRFVTDGMTMTHDGLRIAFLGGVETATDDISRIDKRALDQLQEIPSGSIDLLVTHESPYGFAKGYHGHAQGSKLITGLLDRISPRYHVAGHYHFSSLYQHGRTQCLCLNSIVASARWHPDSKGILPGWLAVLDTQQSRLVPVEDAYISAIQHGLDLESCSEPLVPNADPWLNEKGKKAT